MKNDLLPTGSSPLERAAAIALAEIERIPVPIRQLWQPDKCPVRLLPYLAWAFSVDRWDINWPEKAKREAIKAAMFIHQHKGTIGALKRVVEPLGYLIRVIEWWQTGDAPGTFRLDIGVNENGITEEMYFELEALIEGAKPVSRHLKGLAIELESTGTFYTASANFDGEMTTVYPYTPTEITASGMSIYGITIHLVDTIKVMTS
ncbi:phage tail protein I [Arsenophonus nasoniae]|uniref:Phage tail protein I n=1 Tax=Arsenophonus nasoniae TaxID=638 RepID=A0AA95GHS7_9GAMM|nr:phage tail protein I [Arsenophonus nasoniae]WGL96653.1 phage tail protein I [Arsenophonus nasoniae]